VDAVVASAEAMIEEDIEANRQMGKYGADALVAAVKARGKLPASGKLRVLTICNTGSLATAGELHDARMPQRSPACSTAGVPG
jgi:methylthioribose-1-phosphate isomerase